MPSTGIRLLATKFCEISDVSVMYSAHANGIHDDTSYSGVFCVELCVFRRMHRIQMYSVVFRCIPAVFLVYPDEHTVTDVFFLYLVVFCMYSNVSENTSGIRKEYLGIDLVFLYFPIIQPAHENTFRIR